MTREQYAAIQLVVGVGVILLALGYRRRGDYSSFRRVFLLGHMALVGGTAASNFVNFWIAVGIFVLWFVVAGYFIFQERQEHSGRIGEAEEKVHCGIFFLAQCCLHIER